jgi:hypothetical protein
MTKEKTYNEYKKTNPEQLDLFSFANLFESKKEKYSGTVDLYDVMPKYYHDDIEKIRTEKGLLEPITREFVYKKQKMFLNISPAFVFDKNNKSKSFFPSQREEIIEDVLRKFATDPNRSEFLDDRLSVKFTLYELWKELRVIKHPYDYKEIKESLNILSKTNLEIKTENSKIIFSSNMFETFSRVDINADSDRGGEFGRPEELEEYSKKIIYFVRFNSLVSDSIKNKTWKIINYDQCMSYKRIISRWLHKRISHMFVTKNIERPYNILLSTVIRDSGMTEYKQISDSIIQVKRCIDEMVDIGSIERYDIEKIYSAEKRNRIEDVKFLLWISPSFYEDAQLSFLAVKDREDLKQTQHEKSLNEGVKTTDNMKIIDATNIDGDEQKEKIESIIIEVIDVCKTKGISLRKESIYKLISNVVHDNIEKAVIMTNVDSAIDYIVKQVQKGKSVKNAAIITVAIKENWQTKKDDLDLFDVEETEREQRRKNVISDIEKIKNSDIKQVTKALLNAFDYSIYSIWLKNLELILDRKNNKFILYVENSFVKEYIGREYFESIKKKVNGEWICHRKGIKQIIQDIFPNIDVVLLIKNKDS